MAISTIFKNFIQVVEDKSLILITKDIANGVYKDQIEAIRKFKKEGNQDKVDQLKKELYAFTPSATFEGGRTMKNLKRYSGFVHLDFDKLSSADLAKAKLRNQQMPTTFACFTSPSGNGLKIFVEVTTGIEHHTEAYKQVQAFYEKELGIKADAKCKDITRLCFVSDDAETYRNIANEKFEVLIHKEIEEVQSLGKEEKLTPEYSNEIQEKLYQDCVEFTNKKISYHDGDRNNYVYLLACNCNRRGLPFDQALSFIQNDFDLNEEEIQASVRSAYKHNAPQFASLAQAPKSAIAPEYDQQDFLKATPTFEDFLFDGLPEILSIGASSFSDTRERDVFLTGALSILSGCLPKVKGVYRQETVYPNLFSFIIAPAASGKGALKFAKKLGDKYQDSLLESSKQSKISYETELAEYKAALRQLKKGEVFDQEEPEKPPFQVAFIPANSSCAKILSHIQQNDGAGIIAETEADSMGNVFKQEWGGYSDMLRKAFHHETISLSRKTNDEYIEIKEPKLSVALSGTPGQVTNLISSSEDGLFSRFLFYAFNVDQVWQDVSPYGNPVNLNDRFDLLSTQVLGMVEFFQQSNTTVSLSREQWGRVNTTGQKWLTELTMFTAEEAGSIAKRLGLVLFRIAMIFTAMRKFENAETTTEMLCKDEDFDIALSIVNTFIDHSVLMFNNLPKQEKVQVFKGGDNKRMFYEKLPKKFKRDEAVRLGESLKMKVRTIDNLLKKLCEQDMLSKPEYGLYAKS